MNSPRCPPTDQLDLKRFIIQTRVEFEQRAGNLKLSPVQRRIFQEFLNPIDFRTIIFYSTNSHCAATITATELGNDPLIIVFQLLRSTPKTRRRWIQEEHQVTIKKINDDRMSTIASFWSSIQPKGSSKYPTLENCAPHYSRLLRLGIIMTGKKMLINCLAFIINSAKHFSR